MDWGSYANGTWNTTTDPPSAVRVTASASGLHTFSTISSSPDRSAVAVASSTACYRLGSFVAAVNTGDSTILGPLNDVFGVNMQLVSYQGLAAAKVRLADLAADPTIGSPQALLSGSRNVRTNRGMLYRAGGGAAVINPSRQGLPMDCAIVCRAPRTRRGPLARQRRRVQKHAPTQI